MSKLILTITAALLVGLSMQGQEMYLKNIYYKNNPGDSILMYNFEYQNNWDLKNVTVYGDGEVFQTWKYENDTIIEHITIYDTTYYTHYTDSIFSDSKVYYDIWYYTNSEGQIDIAGDTLYHYIWEDDNFVAVYNQYNILTQVYTYTDYINPFYNMFKSLRIYYTASYNQAEELVSPNGGLTTEWIVVSSLNNYPTEIITWNNGEYSYTQYFEYYINTDTPEIPSEPAKVFSIDYYDIMGRKIEKPQQGFYIERKTTNKGIISKKYFIQ